MAFNPDKCEVIRMTNKKKSTLFKYTLHGICLKETDSAKYLGVTITKDLSWSKRSPSFAHTLHVILIRGVWSAWQIQIEMHKFALSNVIDILYINYFSTCTCTGKSEVRGNGWGNAFFF